MFQPALQVSLMHTNVWESLLYKLGLWSQTTWIQSSHSASWHLLCPISRPLGLHCNSCHCCDNYLDHTLPQLHSSLGFCSVIPTWDTCRNLFNILCMCKPESATCGATFNHWEDDSLLLNRPFRTILWLLLLSSSESPKWAEALWATQWPC